MEVLANSAKPQPRSLQPRYLNTPIPTSAHPRVPSLPLFSPEAREAEPGQHLSALLQGLEANFAAPEQEKLSEKVEGVTENVATPTNQAATLSKTISEGKTAEKLTETASRVAGSQAGSSTSKALEGLNRVSQSAGKVGESAFVLAKPFSIANGVKTLADGEGTTKDKVTAGASLASDLGYSARTLGAAGAAGDGASKVAALASVQNKVAAVAPKAASALGTVGKAAPVIGGAAGVITGGLDIKDAFRGDEVDKSKLASGGLKVASGVALAIPGGLPVAMGLGAAALVIDHKESLVKGAKAVGKGAEKVAKKSAEVVGDTAKKVTGVLGSVL